MSDAMDLASGGSAAEGPAGRAEAGAPPPPGRQWRRRVLGVPALVLLGVLLLIGAGLVDDHQGKRAEELCHRLPVPWQQFALAYASLLCGLAALAVCALLFTAARRAGTRGADTWQGSLALVISVPGLLAVLFEATAVYGTHAASAEPYWRCASAGSLPGTAGLAAALLG